MSSGCTNLRISATRAATPTASRKTIIVICNSLTPRAVDIRQVFNQAVDLVMFKQLRLIKKREPSVGIPIFKRVIFFENFVARNDRYEYDDSDSQRHCTLC